MAVFHTRDVAAEQTRFIFDASCDIFLLSRNSLKRSLITIFVGDSPGRHTSIYRRTRSAFVLMECPISHRLFDRSFG